MTKETIRYMSEASKTFQGEPLWHWEDYQCEVELPGDAKTWKYDELNCAICISKLDEVIRKRATARVLSANQKQNT